MDQRPDARAQRRATLTKLTEAAPGGRVPPLLRYWVAVGWSGLAIG
jgi:hypothetical protein